MCWFSKSENEAVQPQEFTPYLFSLTVFSDASEWLSSSLAEANEFQLKILKVLLVVLFINVALILYAWKQHGQRISERFMKAASNKSLEEFKKEATLLKLPKEHTPRI